MSQVITVFGATGVQGGSVVKAVLENAILSKQYKVRGITRDPAKPAAQALAKKGVELVKADLGDLESIQAAIKGSHAVFAVTNYWESQDPDLEIKQGKNVVDASIKESVHHIVWSSLPYASKLTNGELTDVKHFDSKAEVEEYIRSVPTSKLPVASFFQPAFYMSNLKGMARPGQDGVKTIALPWDPAATQVALLDTARDTGNYVAGLLLAPEEKINRLAVHGVSEWQTPNQIVQTIESVAGEKVNFMQVTRDQAIQPWAEPSKPLS